MLKCCTVTVLPPSTLEEEWNQRPTLVEGQPQGSRAPPANLHIVGVEYIRKRRAYGEYERGERTNNRRLSAKCLPCNLTVQSILPKGGAPQYCAVPRKSTVLTTTYCVYRGLF